MMPKDKLQPGAWRLLNRRLPLPLLLLLLVTYSYLLSSCSYGGALAANPTAPGAKNPLVYTRLRHDQHFLQLYRRYQLKKIPYEEKPSSILINSTTWQPINATNSEDSLRIFYYQNNQVDQSDVTQEDLIFEALDRAYKTRLIQSSLHNYDNINDKRAASDPKLVSVDRCNRELDFLLGKLHLLEHGSEYLQPELAAFFDSYATNEVGLLFGNYHWTGLWRECKRRHIFELPKSLATPVDATQGDTAADPSSNQVFSFNGRYCVASIRSSGWDKKIRIGTEEALATNYFKYPEQVKDYARFFRIQVGFCLPESCDSSTVDLRRDEVRKLALHKLSEPFKSSYQMVDLFCLPDETSPYRGLEPSGWLLILAIQIWSSLIVLATFLDLTQTSKVLSRSKSANESFVSALSLRANWRRLTDSLPLEVSQEEPGQQVTRNGDQDRDQGQVKAPKLAPKDLLFLNSFKAIGMPLLMLGHCGMILKLLDKFPLDYEPLKSNFLLHFIYDFVFIVDWYFVITGFIITYTMFVTNRIERNSILQWLYKIFQRYWRLAPLYLLIFWFCKSLFQHTGEGPIWDYGTNNMTIRSICKRESWLWPLTLTSNFHPFYEECIMPSWYASSDFQYFLITPLLLVSLGRWPFGTWIATLGLIFGSVMLRIYTLLTDARFQPLDLMRSRSDMYMRISWDVYHVYLNPQYRISSYLIGVLTGHYTFQVLSGSWTRHWFFTLLVVPKEEDRRKIQRERNQDDEEEGYFHLIIRRFLRPFAWLAGLHIVIIMQFCTLLTSEWFPSDLEPYSRPLTAIAYGFAHTLTAFGMALLIISFMFGQFPWIKGVLSMPIWSLVSRLNYIILLIQVEVIYWLVQTGAVPPVLSGQSVFILWVSLMFVCYTISPILALWFELPLIQLERRFLATYLTNAKRDETRMGTEAGRQRQEQRRLAQEVITLSPKLTIDEALEL